MKCPLFNSASEKYDRAYNKLLIRLQEEYSSPPVAPRLVQMKYHHLAQIMQGHAVVEKIFFDLPIQPIFEHSSPVTKPSLPERVSALYEASLDRFNLLWGSPPTQSLRHHETSVFQRSSGLS